ncbi:hypothetical protein GCM10025863_28690 [Microbacterium suwonense]|uniref:Uncharacterized protein n=1 Tax=Microbacterium suwonense TaxID=683047 RepID=A0ABM8FXD2_9MICO|nr:hypothetical protein GCM10025863_28690 [Microbacterium suwonense]
MPGQADAAAHRDAVGEGDDRLRVLGDERVHRVLGAEEPRDVARMLAHDLLVQRPHVAAGTEAALALAVDQHGLDVGIIDPGRQGGRDAIDHLEVEGVDRSRTVQRDPPE